MTTPLQPDRPAPGHADGAGHHHGHAHPPAPALPQPAGAALPGSLLMAGALSRLAGVAGLLLLLWLAVAWALGEPA